MKTAVITGASTGIGYATTARLLNADFHVFGSVRNEADANRLQRSFGRQFTPLIFDVTDEAGIKQAVGLVREALKGKTLDVLINNAGIAVSGPLQFVPLEKFKLQLDVNVIGLLAVTQAFLPLLGGIQERKENPGRIINISSVSGVFVTPFMGPYCASKFALEAMNDAMRRELELYGIKVVSVQPGPIKTEIWRKAKEDDTSYPDTIYQPFLEKRSKIIDKRSKNALPVEDVANLLYKITIHKSPKTRYLIAPNSLQIKFIRLLPDRWADQLIFKLFLSAK